MLKLKGLRLCCFVIHIEVIMQFGAVAKTAEVHHAGANVKRIEWYTERCGSVDLQQNASLCADAIKFATVTHPDLVDGLMPCCGMLQIDCSTGLLVYDISHYNFSAYAAFLAAGKSVRVTIQGTGTPQGIGSTACCQSSTNCTMLQNKEKLAAQLLELAQTYNLTGYTGDWEWQKPSTFYWPGWNETMAYISSVLAPHGIGIGNGIVSGCEGSDLCAPGGGTSDPCCCPAFRDMPWADVLVDMGAYSIFGNSPSWSKNGVRGHCPHNTGGYPNVTQYCGWEGGIMDVLHSPIVSVFPDRSPQIAPAIWIGDCSPNGTTTAQGWTQTKLSAFLNFLDRQRISQIGIWCMTNNSDPIGFPCPVDSCPWMYEELRAWKHR